MLRTRSTASWDQPADVLGIEQADQPIVVVHDDRDAVDRQPAQHAVKRFAGGLARDDNSENPFEQSVADANGALLDSYHQI